MVGPGLPGGKSGRREGEGEGETVKDRERNDSEQGLKAHSCYGLATTWLSYANICRDFPLWLLVLVGCVVQPGARGGGVIEVLC